MINPLKSRPGTVSLLSSKYFFEAVFPSHDQIAFFDQSRSHKNNVRTLIMQRRYPGLCGAQTTQPPPGITQMNQIPLSKKITFHFQPDSNIPLNLFDIELIKFAFLHIIRNAMQAMPDGGNLIVRTIYGNSMIIIDIIDQGIGIEKEYLPHIFDVFFSTKTRNTGLGLTFAKIIIESHGGEISFESTPHQGTKCTIFFPVRS